MAWTHLSTHCQQAVHTPPVTAVKSGAGENAAARGHGGARPLTRDDVDVGNDPVNGNLLGRELAPDAGVARYGLALQDPERG